jgi:hypothetical protein
MSQASCCTWTAPEAQTGASATSGKYMVYRLKSSMQSEVAYGTQRRDDSKVKVTQKWTTDLFFFNFYFFIIHMCIQCLGHFSPLPPPPPLLPTLPPPCPPNPLDTWQKLFCPYL